MADARWICCVTVLQVHPSRETKEPTNLWMMACNDVGISSPPQGFVCYNTETGQIQSWHENDQDKFVGEAVVATPTSSSSSTAAATVAEDEELSAYILGLTFDARTGRRSLCVFESEAISKGPICRLNLKHPVAWGIHATYVPDFYVDPPAALPSAL